MRVSVCLLLLALGLARAQEIPFENPWGPTNDASTVAYLSAGAQAMLSQSYNFTSTLTGPDVLVAVDAGEMGKLTLLPGPPGLPLAYALLEIGPCSMILPHTHPMGNEIEYSLVGKDLKGGLMPLGATTMEVRDIPPGTLSIYPQGLIHTQFNMGCDRASLFVNFDKPYPNGLITVGGNVVGMPAWMAAASLNAYGGNFTDAEMKAMQAEAAKIGSNPETVGQLTFTKLPESVCKCP